MDKGRVKCLEVTLSSDLLVKWANLWGLSNRKKDFRYKRESFKAFYNDRDECNMTEIIKGCTGGVF